jgi:CarD family transcriptional regulator
MRNTETEESTDRSVAMFAEGDFISHGTNGVCRVAGFTQMDVPGTGEKKEYYILKPVYDSNATVYSPVESGDTLKCRSILTEEEAKKLIGDIPTIAPIEACDRKELEEKCKQAISSGLCSEWVRVIKTLWEDRRSREGQGKKMTAASERFLKQAEEKLHGELAVSLGMQKQELTDYLCDLLMATK